MTDRTKTIVTYAMSLCSILAMLFLFLALWQQQRNSPEYVTPADTLYPDFYYDSLHRKAQNGEREQPAHTCPDVKTLESEIQAWQRRAIMMDDFHQVCRKSLDDLKARKP